MPVVKCVFITVILAHVVIAQQILHGAYIMVFVLPAAAVMFTVNADIIILVLAIPATATPAAAEAMLATALAAEDFQLRQITAIPATATPAAAEALSSVMAPAAEDFQLRQITAIPATAMTVAVEAMLATALAAEDFQLRPITARIVIVTSAANVEELLSATALAAD